MKHIYEDSDLDDKETIGVAGSVVIWTLLGLCIAAGAIYGLACVSPIFY
jgi:hypothetical protein